MHTVLETKDLRKYFPLKAGLWAKTIGWIKAVDGVSFSIVGEQTFALVGESGCGKTTTAKLILLLEEATAGSVLFHGRDITKLKGKELHRFRASVQAVFQDPFASLSPRMRVKSIVAEPLVANTNLSRIEIQERVAEVLAQVKLAPQTGSLFPHEFSGGQRQRIAIARSLIVRPSLVILDEPVSSLDVSIQAQIMNLLKDLQVQSGVSYLLIAHSLATIRYMSDQIGVMYLGKLVEQGASEEVFMNQLHPYTRALFAAALPAHPDLVKEDIILPGEVPSELDLPSGCRFRPRCSFAMAICSEAEPGMKEVAPGHRVACYLY